ncbi:MAG: tetratricopeptide repeat protein [Brevinematales bacterium]|nr:tetratricopeptide repeat protein [Brevinematales bacterium]
MVRLLYFFVFLGFVSCSSYYRFDEAYDKRDFLKAYSILENIKNKNNFNYQKREYRIVLRLSLEGDKDFIHKLSNLVEKDIHTNIINYKNFGLAYLLFLNSKTKNEYSNTLLFFNAISNVPVEFKEYFYKMKGICEYKIGEYDKAIEDLKLSYHKFSSSDTLYFIGMSYLNQKKFKEAKEFFEKIVNTTLDNFFNALAYFQIGEIYYEEGKYKEALEYYLKAQETYSDIPNFAFKTSKCLSKLGYNSLAEKFLKIAMRIDKNYATAWFYLNIN